jgi:hypothetical protein
MGGTMKVFRFKGGGQLHAITTDFTGGNLPEHRGPWEFETEMELEEDDGSFAATDANKALDDIKERGYHVGGVELLFEERE